MIVSMRKGQSVVEYAVLVAVVIAALLALNIFIKRGFQGRYRNIGEQAGSQFSFVNSTTNIREMVNSARNENTFPNGVSTTTFTTDRQNRNETVTLGVSNSENLFY